MARLILLNKPFRMLSQFTTHDDKRTLSDCALPKGVYAAGRLDWDSEGLLLLTDDGALQAQLSSPRFHLPKTYWVQVEGLPDDASLGRMASGLELKDGPTRPAKVERMAPPAIWPRTPPVRERLSVPDCWLALTITEGRNRQVRRMTAAIGHPTLRLVRAQIGNWALGRLAPGQWREENVVSSALPHSVRPRKSDKMRRCQESK
jgi:23S rRNA pseudouridine2457 synthase